MRVLFLIPLLALAACGTPYERCNRDAAAPYRDALQERERIAKDLARGYTFSTEWESRMRWDVCGSYDGRLRYCWRRDTEPVTRRVPINAEALRMRDAQIEEQLPQLRYEASQAQAICRQRYPVEVEALASEAASEG